MNTATKAPVAVIAFVRRDVLDATLRRLSLAEGVLEREVLVYLSAPRNDAEKRRTDAVRELVEGYKKTSLPNITIVPREKNFGAGLNIRNAITDALEVCGKAIIVEDDILISRTFLRYMDEALEYYESDPRVWCINGYQNAYMSVPKKYPYDVYINPMNMAPGWGTWKDRWQAVDFSLADWGEFISSKTNQANLDKAGCDIGKLIELAISGKIDTWDVQCTYHMIKNGMFCIEPRFSLTKNNGMNTVGAVHCTRRDGFISKQKYFDFMPKLRPVDELTLVSGMLSRRLKYSVRDSRPIYFAIRCLLRYLRSFLGQDNLEPFPETSIVAYNERG